MKASDMATGFSILVPVLSAFLAFFFDKLLSRDGKFSDWCDNLRNQIVARRAQTLRAFLDDVAPGFDNIESATDNLYVDFVKEELQYSKYYERVEMIQRRFQLSHTALFFLVVIEVIAFALGFVGILPENLMVYAVAAGLVFTVILALNGHVQDSNLRRLRNEPKLLTGKV